ncbi:MAG: sigma-54-dependent transcriptional regulator [Spirochaetota bacterium]
MNLDPAILIVDDDELIAERYALLLHEAGLLRTETCTDSRVVIERLSEQTFDLVLLDLNMPHVDGFEILDGVSERFPELHVIVVTGLDKVDTAVECMKRGAFDFLSKPVDANRLVTAVRHSLQIRSLREELVSLNGRIDDATLNHPESFAEIVTVSPKMQSIFAYIEAVATSPKSALIVGESGTGKELIARAIHSVSNRKGPFVPVNVSGLDDAMFSDTLFGHSRGAYTGADRAREGLIAQAADGTLFLDEIGDLGLSSQMKLLRLLQEEEYYPLGSDVPKKARVRIVAATNADLVSRQEEGSFRRDLYFRLMAHTVRLPALRNRPEDIGPLVRHFVVAACDDLGKPLLQVPESLVSFLSRYSFPGNVRELQSLIYDAVSLSPGPELSASYFEHALKMEPVAQPVAASTNPQSAQTASMSPGLPNGSTTDGPVILTGTFPKLADVERFLIDEALRRAGGNQTTAASMLGVSQSTLSRRTRRTGS